jgi:hypothetical protein
MKNQYKQRQRQIDKSIRGDWTQNIYYFEDRNKIKEKREKKENKPKLVFKNGKLIRNESYKNGVPFSWEDKIF